MVLDEPFPAFLTGTGILVLLGALLAVVTLPRWREAVMPAGALLLAAFIFIEWKHGFVRADGHVYIYYQFAGVAAPMILLYAGASERGNSRIRVFLARGLTAAAMVLSVWADGRQAWQRHWWEIRELPRFFGASWRQILLPVAEKKRLSLELDRQREKYRLPLLRDIVGGASIDFFGT